MSQENVELVRNAFQNANLEEVAQAYWHPEIEYVEDPRWPGASRYKGRDAVLHCFRDYTEALGSEMLSTVERVIDAGKHQVAFVRFEGRSASGMPHQHLWGYLVEANEQRIVYVRAYYNPEEALKAAGLGD